MKNNKKNLKLTTFGFTLIELLAVIVILAVIALIVTPVIMGIISDAKLEAYKRQIEAVKKAAEYYSIKHNGTIENTSVSVDTLESEGFISNVINPLTGNSFETGLNVDISIDNAGKVNYGIYEGPELVSGLIPVYYDETAMVWKKADKSNANNNWYDYDNFKWANAVTVTSTNRTTIVNAAVGTTIPMTDINTMFVWIPRFSYKQVLDKNNFFTDVLINFETISIPKSTGDGINTYLTHPGFTFGDEELNGLWIGKFETTGTSTAVTIKPDTKSLVNLEVKKMFDAVKNTMQSNTTTYGFISDNDIHMSKSIEWRTAFFLVLSKYGKYYNSNYTGDDRYLFKNNSSYTYTGRSLGSYEINGATTPTYNYSSTGYYTYDGKCAMIHAALPAPCNAGSVGQVITNKNLAYGASTTGTIYGVYDMSGGASEWQMRLRTRTDIAVTDYSLYSSTTSSSTFDLLTIDPKYYIKTAYGDSNYPGEYLQWGGGGYGGIAAARQIWHGYGMFYSGSSNGYTTLLNDGNNYTDLGFRVVITP